MNEPKTIDDIRSLFTFEKFDELRVYWAHGDRHVPGDAMKPFHPGDFAVCYAEPGNPKLEHVIPKTLARELVDKGAINDVSPHQWET